MNHLLVRLLLWPITLILCPIPATLLPRSFAVEVLESIRPAELSVFPNSAPFVTTPPALSATTSAALPQERTLGRARQWTERVLVYLEKAEKKEIDPWLRDDIRIAWITTKWAQSGVPEWSLHRNFPPYAAATYQVLHCLPHEVWPRIVAQRQEKLGSAYSRFYDATDNRLPEVSAAMKKPCASERRRVLSRERAASGNLAA